MKTRQQFDMNSPGAAELRDKIVHGAFKTEGQMAAFPLCFPSVSIPIRADESKITALDATADGVIYGGTSGFAAHLFVAMFHGVTGMVFDMGVAEDCDYTAAICCGEKQFFAALNGPKGPRIVVRDFQETPFSLIQEWSIQRSPYTYADLPVPGKQVIHAVATQDRTAVIGATDRAVFRYDFASRSIEQIAEVQTSSRLVTTADGAVIGRGKGRSVWRYVPSGPFEENAATLPDAEWSDRLVWAADPDAAVVYTADAGGRLYSYGGPGTGFSSPLGQVPYAPVTSMAVTFDGRVFGSAGTDMQRVFCYDPDTTAITDIGVAASTLQQRRYCYEYGDAVTGRDGEIVFGEDDDLGHLWLYYPRIKRRSS